MKVEVKTQTKLSVQEFESKVVKIENYSDLKKFVLDNNMPNVAARCLGIGNSDKNFGKLLCVLDGDFSVAYFIEHYKELKESNIGKYEEYKAQKQQNYLNGLSDDYYGAMEKNYYLVNDYEKFKDSMCGGIGQRRIKLMLNKLIQDGDIVAAMYRALLETENTNINAKKYNNTRSVSYKDNLYAEKESLIKSVIDLFRMYNDEHPGDARAVYGKEKAHNYSANWIVYFDAPGMKQVSFHTNIEDSYIRGLPDYPAKWDGMVNSTLGKIEKAINERYPEEITELKAKIAKENEAKARKREKERAERLAKQEEGRVVDVK